jgi:hypothetical protein
LRAIRGITEELFSGHLSVYNKLGMMRYHDNNKPYNSSFKKLR